MISARYILVCVGGHITIPTDQPEPEDHRDWQAERRAAINYFLSTLSLEAREKLDFSPASLQIIGAWLLKRYPSLDSAEWETDVRLLYGVVCYVGECYRQHLGGFWAIYPDNPELGHPHIDEQVIVKFNPYSEGDMIRPALKIRETLITRIEPYLGQNLKALIRTLLK
jgi:hypothetical protein